MYEYKQFYRRKLPHRHSPGRTLFVTFRLANSIPQSVIRQYQNDKLLLQKQIEKAEKTASTDALIGFRREWFVKFEEILDKATHGPTWLRHPEIAGIVAEAFHFHNEKSYDLKAYSIMANHAHVVFTPLLNERSIIETSDNLGLVKFESSDMTMATIMKSLKGYTSRRVNRLLGRTGKFWETESYDHEIRDDDEFYRVVWYVLKNPVKAGVVKEWRSYKWNWIKPTLEERF